MVVYVSNFLLLSLLLLLLPFLYFPLPFPFFFLFLLFFVLNVFIPFTFCTYMNANFDNSWSFCSKKAQILIGLALILQIKQWKLIYFNMNLSMNMAFTFIYLSLQFLPEMLYSSFFVGRGMDHRLEQLLFSYSQIFQALNMIL